MKSNKVIKMVLVLMLAALIIANCTPAVDGDANEVKSTITRNENPEFGESEIKELVDGNTQFAVDFYQAVSGEEGNLFYSPYSISLALAMTYGGARGNTETEMAETLSFNLPQERLHKTFNGLDHTLASRDEGIEEGGFKLNIANSIWAQEDYPFLDEYLDVLAENYGTGMNLVNFITSAEEVRLTINDWVSEKTEEKIKDLIPPGLIDDLTRLVLANAIYFKADWQNQFDPSLTADEPFKLIGGEEITVPMMSMDRPPHIPYYQGEDFEAVEMPYKGGELSMVLVVPDHGNFQQVEERFSTDLLSEITGGMAQKGVDLTMPKFGFESTFALSKTLKLMGMLDAFDPRTADLSGMDGTTDLYIKAVLHKAFVAVDEEGTEAAAATAVIVGIESMPVIDVEMTVDRPFLFFIRDIPTGSILFVGRVMNPLVE